MKAKNINIYKIVGHFKNKGEMVNFSRNIRSLTESDAKQEIFLHFGSKHKIKRPNIKFDSISIVQNDDDKMNKVLSSSEEFKYIRG